MKRWEYYKDFAMMKHSLGSFKNKRFYLDHFSRSFPIFIREIIYQDCYRDWEYYAENPIASSIEIPLEGEMVMEVDDRMLTVHTGEVFILRPGMHQHLRTGASGFCRKAVAIMSGPNQLEILNTLFGDNSVFAIKSPDIYIGMLENITALFQQDDENKLPEISNLSYSFLVKLASELENPGLPQTLRIAMNAIDTLKNTRMTAEDIAANLHISAVQLSRLFKKHLNTTLRQYIIKVRMTSAAQLLKHTDMKIKKISAASGYSLEVNFIADFSKFYGIPPMQYRQKHRSGDFRADFKSNGNEI